MSSFAKKGYTVASYAKFRPVYPQRLLQYIVDYFKSHNEKSVELVVDVACGTGQATRMLAHYSKKVIGLDNSESMIHQAKTVEPKLANVEFKEGSDRTSAAIIPHTSVDISTVAEGAHWMQYPLFWNQCAQVLRPGGTLAVFGYWSFALPDYPEVAQIVLDYLYGEDQCGPYWDKGREILDNGYKTLETSSSEHPAFKDLEYRVNHYDKSRPDEPFESVRENVPVESSIGHLKTVSAYFNFKRANPGHFDIADAAMQKITEKTGLTGKDLVRVKWNSVYLSATRK